MPKFIGIILLAGAILLISIIGKPRPAIRTTSKPSETAAPRTNIQYPSSGDGTAISNPSKSEATRFRREFTSAPLIYLIILKNIFVFPL